MTALSISSLHKSFHQGGRRLDILKGAEMALEKGTIAALVGQSGTGKSTFLQICGLLDHADAGDVIIAGSPYATASDSARTAVRRKEIGFIYQFHHLMPDFTAVENVAMPLLIDGVSGKEATNRATELLIELGLKDRLSHFPAELSGGEQQRVAIARALVHQPSILLADEPTGNLDTETAERVMQALIDVVKKRGVAALIATHDRELAGRMDKTFQMADGLLSEL